MRSLEEWLQASGITTGPLWRAVGSGGVDAQRLGDRSVALALKRGLERAGLDASRFAGHSLRRGLVTAAAKAGKAERDIARTTGHRSLAVLRGYIEEASVFEDNAAAGTCTRTPSSSRSNQLR